MLCSDYLAIHKKTIAKMKHSGEQLIVNPFLFLTMTRQLHCPFPLPHFPLLLEKIGYPTKFIPGERDNGNFFGEILILGGKDL